MSGENGVPVTPTQQFYVDAAQALIEEITGMRQKVPNLVIPESVAARRRLVNAASVPKQFVDLAAVAVRNNAALVRGGSQDLDKDRDLSNYAEAFGPVADKLEALALFVRHSVAAAKNRVGNEALTTYALACRLAKRPEMADLAPDVLDMSKALGRRGRKPKSKPAPTPVTPDTPAPTQPSPVTTTAAKTA